MENLIRGRQSSAGNMKWGEWRMWGRRRKKITFFWLPLELSWIAIDFLLKPRFNTVVGKDDGDGCSARATACNWMKQIAQNHSKSSPCSSRSRVQHCTRLIWHVRHFTDLSKDDVAPQRRLQPRPRRIVQAAAAAVTLAVRIQTVIPSWTWTAWHKQDIS